MWHQAATDRMISSWPASKGSNYAELHRLQCQGPPWLWSTARHNSGREIMAQTVRRIMLGQSSGGEILIHQPVDLGPEEVWPMPFRAGKEIRAGRVVCAPALQGLLHIRGQIHDPIPLPFAPVNTDGTRVEINGVPRQRTDLRDA